MKKCIIIFSLFVFPFVNAQIEPPKNNPENLKGNVKSIELIGYSAVDYFGELKKDTIYRTTLINLDINNNYLNWKKISKNKSDEIGEIIYTDKIKFKEIKRIRNNDEIDLSQWKYDNQGNIVEFYEYEGDILINKETAIYNKNNKITEYKSYIKDGKLYWKKNWKYDLKNNLIEYESISTDGFYNKETYKIENGKIIETLYFDYKGNMVSRKKHNYHTSGKIKEVVEEFYDSEDFSRIIYRYNMIGKPLSELAYDKNYDMVYIKGYKYDIKNNLIFSEDYHSKDKYTYDNNGNILTKDVQYKMSKRTHRNKKVTRVIYSFEYDSIGNKIKEITSYYLEDNLIEDSHKTVEERIITYR